MRKRKSKEQRQADFEKQQQVPQAHPGSPVVRPGAPQTGVTKIVVHHLPEGDVVEGPQPGMAPQPQPQAPVQQPGMQPQPQRTSGTPVRPYGTTQVVHPGEVPPNTTVGPNPPVAPMPSSSIVQGMHPPHMRVSQGVYPSSMRQHPQPAAPPGAPAQLVVETAPAEEPAEPLDLTVILTSWMRPGLMRPQVLALAQQSRPPAGFIAWINQPQVAPTPGVLFLDEEILAGVIQVRSTINWGPWPRFLLASEAQTEYVAIFDDDVIPGDGWLEAAVQVIEERGVAVAVTGSLFDQDGNERRVGAVPGKDGTRTVVDAGRQGWVLRREWLDAILAFPRKGHRLHGWGIHLAAALQKNGVDTVVLPYLADDPSTWGTTTVEANDGLRNAADAAEIRSAVFAAYRELGWRLQVEGAPVEENAPEEKAGG